MRPIVFALTLLCSSAALAGPKDFVVYAPGMGGTAEQARPYLETFFRDLEKEMSWPTGSADGQYFEEESAVAGYLASKKPGYGLVTPGMYLDLACKKESIDIVATVVGVANAGSSARYHVVVKNPDIKELKDLQGKKVSSNHLQNAKFISAVVFAGKLDAQTYFKLEPTNSPIKPFKLVDRGEADAALVDDAQLAHMNTLPFGKELRVLYSSEPLPPFPVVSFGKVVKPAERDAMKKTLLGLCATATGAPVCKSLSITRFEAVDPAAYKSALAQYCK